jgi:hypothetical protein
MENENRIRILKDNDGHTYFVPVGDEDEFYKWVDDVEDDKFHPGNWMSIGCSLSVFTFVDPREG